jgi:perosamine synthetase
MFRFVPPAGAPLKMTQILCALKTVFSPNGDMEGCLSSLASHLHVRSVFGASSGRAALWIILNSLHRLRPDRSVVALPAYICFSVPASVVRAGLRLHPVEINSETLDYDFSQLEAVPEEDLLCILTSHLFGLVNDVPRIRRIAQAKGAFLVDDAAQALGASWKGQPAGTLGDVGFWSLSRGKALGTVEGGIIITNSEEIGGAIQTEVQALPPSSLVHSASVMLKMLAGWLLLNPRYYWMLNALPFLKLGITEYSTSFPATRLAKPSLALLGELMDRLAEINRIRSKNAESIIRALEGNRAFAVPRPAPECQPIYIRLPVLAKDGAFRRRALDALWREGFGASPYYPSAICDIVGIEPHMSIGEFHRPQAENLSRRLLTLPTHALVSARDLERMAEILTEIAPKN